MKTENFGGTNPDDDFVASEGGLTPKNLGEIATANKAEVAETSEARIAELEQRAEDLASQLAALKKKLESRKLSKEALADLWEKIRGPVLAIKDLAVALGVGAVVFEVSPLAGASLITESDPVVAAQAAGLMLGIMAMMVSMGVLRARTFWKNKARQENRNTAQG